MMRTSTLHLHLRPEEAHALIEFIDQLRERLLECYGDDIQAMLQEASSQTSRDERDDEMDRDPF